METLDELDLARSRLCDAKIKAINDEIALLEKQKLKSESPKRSHKMEKAEKKVENS